MTAIVRYPYVEVYYTDAGTQPYNQPAGERIDTTMKAFRLPIGNATIVRGDGTTPAVLAVQITYGFDLQVAEATITCTSLPPTLSYGSEIVVVAATRGDTVASQTAATAMGPRFDGTVVEMDFTLWPSSVDLICKGPLYAASKCYNGNQVLGPATDPYPQNGGSDLTNGGVGRTDQDIITQLLSACQILTTVYIAGTGYTFGLVVPDQCRWSEGQSVLDCINKFDDVCLGYRTYDDPIKLVVRSKVSQTSRSTATPVATFTEGVDIISGTNRMQILDARGRIQVTGGTKTKGTDASAFFFDTGDGSDPAHLPDGRTPTSAQAALIANDYTEQTDTVSSPLIEKTLVADSGSGLSCEEVAWWKLVEENAPLSVVQFETPRDDVILPGQVITVLAANRLMVWGNFWVQRVETSITDAGVFTQQLTVLGSG